MFAVFTRVGIIDGAIWLVAAASLAAIAARRNRVREMISGLGAVYSQVLRADKPDALLRLDPGADMGSVAVSPDGRWVVTGTHGAGVIKLWNAQSGEFVRELIPRDAVIASPRLMQLR